jgi:uncharacterized Zn finger protein
MYYQWRPYVSVAERRRKAASAMAKRAKKGQVVSPVVIDGRTIARTFWGKAWCENLESYSDYSNRLPRGRTYVRNGSVVHLAIEPGLVKATVSGSELYEVKVQVAGVPAARWKGICSDCAGGISSLVELLQGRFSAGVMERICQQRTGLFPAPSEIKLSCSCPDWASMCKHVAAVLYGVGARLDHSPELIFKLREVDEKDLIAKAEKSVPLAKRAPAAEKIVVNEDLSALFGVEMASDGRIDSPGVAVAPKVGRGRRRPIRSEVKVAAKPPLKKKPKKAESSRSPSRGSGRAGVRNRRGKATR